MAQPSPPPSPTLSTTSTASISSISTGSSRADDVNSYTFTLDHDLDIDLTDRDDDDFEIISSSTDADARSSMHGTRSESGESEEIESDRHSEGDSDGETWDKMSMVDQKTPAITPSSVLSTATTTPQGSIHRNSASVTKLRASSKTTSKESMALSFTFPDPLKGSAIMLDSTNTADPSESSARSSVENSVLLAQEEEGEKRFGSTYEHVKEREERKSIERVEKIVNNVDEKLKDKSVIKDAGTKDLMLSMEGSAAVATVTESPAHLVKGVEKIEEVGHETSSFETPSHSQENPKEEKIVEDQDPPEQELRDVPCHESISKFKADLSQSIVSRDFVLAPFSAPSGFQSEEDQLDCSDGQDHVSTAQTAYAFFRSFADRYLKVTLGGPTLVILIAILAATTATWTMMPINKATGKGFERRADKHVAFKNNESGSSTSVTVTSAYGHGSIPIPSATAAIHTNPQSFYGVRVESPVPPAQLNSKIVEAGSPYAASSSSAANAGVKGKKPRIGPAPAYQSIGCGSKCHALAFDSSKRSRDVERCEGSKIGCKKGKENSKKDFKGKGKEENVEDMFATLSKIFRSPVMDVSEVLDILKTFFVDAWKDLQVDLEFFGGSNLFDNKSNQVSLEERREQLIDFLRVAVRYVKALENKKRRGAKKLMEELKMRKEMYKARMRKVSDIFPWSDVDLGLDLDYYVYLNSLKDGAKEAKSWGNDVLRKARKGAGRVDRIYRHRIQARAVGRKTCKKSITLKPRSWVEDPVMNLWQDFGVFV